MGHIPKTDSAMKTLIYLVVLVPSLLYQVHARDDSTPVVTCSKWATKKTVKVTPDTVATIISDIERIRRCTSVFKLSGGCTEMRLSCSRFNVPRGPGRLFFASCMGTPQPRRRYDNGNLPTGLVCANKMRVIYRGKRLNSLTCRVICTGKY